MDERFSLRWVSAFLLAGLIAAPVAAQQPLAFPERKAAVLTVPRLQTRQIAALTATLDKMLAKPASPDAARSALWNFGRQLQRGTMTRTQEAGVVQHLKLIARRQATNAAAVDDARRMITTLTPGKTAPEIVGKDLEGADLRLSQSRGKVVVLMFSAEWCGICRTLNPYERLLSELYKNWPFEILSVETGSSRDGVRKLKKEQGLAHRSWWDGNHEGGPGEISQSWNAQGFPTLYVIDAQGTIRFVDVRDEDLLKAVRQLLDEQVTQADLAARTRPAAKPGG